MTDGPPPREEPRREAYENPIRKMEVDEDYDDNGDEDVKHPGGAPPGRGATSPRGMVNGQGKQEPPS